MALDDVSETYSDKSESRDSNFNDDYLFKSDKDSFFDEISNLPDTLEDYIDLEDDILNGNLEEPDDTSPNAAYTSHTSSQITKPTEVEVDLYDLGATRHMSGFHHKFINFIETKLVPITTAYTQIFQATGRGDMYIFFFFFFFWCQFKSLGRSPMQMLQALGELILLGP
ncbi:hypothetical protein BYT27DRAFT_7099637 [Phlegmacium glaucopus]|nr:hypothetical protein BYT27DRAFT_7099637 [Phlegmacium glaucopus]